MKFDIKSIALSETSTMVLRDGTGEKVTDKDGNEFSITVYGPSSKQYQKAKHGMEKRMSERTLAKMQGKQDGHQSWSDKLDERATFLANCTKSFNGDFGPDDLSGHELFKAVYSDLDVIYIADDVEKFISDKVNFTKPSKEG